MAQDKEPYLVVQLQQSETARGVPKHVLLKRYNLYSGDIRNIFGVQPDDVDLES